MGKEREMKITTAYAHITPEHKRGSEKCKESKDKDCKEDKDRKEMTEFSPCQTVGVLGGSFRYTQQISKKG